MVAPTIRLPPHHTPPTHFPLLLAGKQPAELRIYDPYYCAGQVKRNLESLGFPNVYNVCEDFYAVIAEGRTPEYDVLITNPPYGRVPFDHVEKLTAFLATQAKPWLVVQPAYCYTKDYWPVLMGGLAPQPFFLTPASPRGYIYQTPKGMRGVLKAKKLKTSPFVTFWYGWFGEHQGGLFQWWMEHGFRECSGMSLAAQSLSLPDGLKSSNDRSRRKAKRRPGENTTPTAFPCFPRVQHPLLYPWVPLWILRSLFFAFWENISLMIKNLSVGIMGNGREGNCAKLVV